MARYAATTQVPVETTRQEIETLLKRRGATRLLHGWAADGRALLAFEMEGRQVRLLLRMPDRMDREFTHDASGKERTTAKAQSFYEQAERQRWRALLLIIKARFEAIDAGITTLEREFLADVVLPDGQSLGDAIRPQIESAYQTGNMPPLLPHFGQSGER